MTESGERDRQFEAWNESESGHGFSLKRYPDGSVLAGEYRDERAQSAWEVWQWRDRSDSKAVEFLALMYERWEAGAQCYEDPEDCAGFLGQAVKLSAEEENGIIAVLEAKG